MKANEDVNALSSQSDEVSSQHPDFSREFMRTTFEQIDKKLFETDKHSPVVKLASPDEIRQAIDLSINDQGRCHNDLTTQVAKILEYSVNTSSPHFHNQLFAGCTPEAITGEFLTAATNVSMYTYEVAPVFSVMEQQVFAKMFSQLGWSEQEVHDGIFCPGGSMSNMYGMNLARFSLCRRLGIDVKRQGMAAVPRLAAFYSEQGHYSIQKAAAFLGIGMDNVIAVKADEYGRMVPAALETAVEEAIARGQTPFFIQATAATTVLGGFDLFNEVCDIAEKHNIWVHVDGAWGASIVLSPQHRHLMAGVERCDSVSWNPHKMMGVPLQCSAFLCRHDDTLMPAHAYGAKYLFQKDKLNTELDTGDKSVQCGRKVDVMKLWLSWAHYGDEGYRCHVDNFMARAQYLASQVIARPHFQLVTPDVGEHTASNVCFWYIPPSARDEEFKGSANMSKAWKNKVHLAAASIKERMQKKGSCMIGFQSIPLHDDPEPANFFRMVVMSSIVTDADMDYLLNECETLGEEWDLEQSDPSKL
jgi:sulfinoalanine decarboxylase